MTTPTTTKLSISLPTELYMRGEQERTRRGISRSEFVANLYREHLRTMEDEARATQYAEAYAKHPESEDDCRWVTEASATTLAAVVAEDSHDWTGDYRLDTEQMHATG